MHVLIIGGGAAGMAAAIEAARGGARVTLAERMDRVGKKLLATGNGRCNLMNTGALRFPGGAGFAAQVLSHCGMEEQRLFWHSLGLRLREEDAGRVYPVSGQSSTVLDTLRFAMEQLGVEVLTGVQVDGLHREKRGFSALTAQGPLRADRVIVTGGGCAQPKLGSDGSAWPLMTALGHRLVKPRPALTQIVTDPAPIRGLSGLRVKATVSVLQGKRCLHEERGEVLFADYGVSGVCVMQCARYADKGCRLRLGLLDGMGFADAEDARREIEKRRREWATQPMERLLTGLCLPRLASALCQAAGIRWKERSIGSLTRGECDALCAVLAGFDLEVRGVKGFEAAQVTAGGLAVEDFCPKTMESTLVPGLYAAGEMLDVDGDCGGFNLLFAFGSGMLAGRAAAKE